MAGRMPIHFFLLILCVGGLSVYFIQYFRQNLTPKVKEKCTDIKNWCKNTENAITCGVSMSHRINNKMDGLYT